MNLSFRKPAATTLLVLACTVAAAADRTDPPVQAPAANADPSPPANPAPDPPAIDRLRAGGLEVKAGGIIGRDFRFWLITSEEGRQAFVATTAEGYLVRGKIYSPDGTLSFDSEGVPPLYLKEEDRRARGLARLTGAPATASTDFAWRAPAPQAPAPAGSTGTVWDRLGHATAIEEGVPGAPLVYIFIDPYCPYCHQQWRALRRKLAQGKLRVRWVPVAVLSASQDNPGVTGGLLADPRPETLAGWMRERRVRPDESAPAKRALGLNSALFQALAAPSVPAILYKDKTGRLITKVGVSDL